MFIALAIFSSSTSVRATGDIVVMDNLSSLKVKGVAEAINAVGAKVLYLPPYSPDLRKEKARTKELLEKEIANAINTVTIKDILGWFRKINIVYD